MARNTTQHDNGAQNVRRAAPRQTARDEPDHDEETGEVTNNDNAVVVRGDFGLVETGEFEVVRHVSVPMLEVPAGAMFIARMVDKMRVLKPLDGVKPEFPGDHIASTIEATTGAVRLFTWSSVFKSEMERDYPNDSYVGKWFQITKLPKKRGKRYFAFAISEVKPKGGTIEGTAQAA